MLANAGVNGNGGTVLDTTWPKLNGLERLCGIDAEALRILPFFAFEVADWDSNRKRVLRDLIDARLGPVVVVRSCAALEDANQNEPPGFFDSVLGVITTASTELEKAIDRVCQSYLRRTDHNRLRHKVIVQTQLLRPKMSGVCSVSEDENAYLEVEYDDRCGRTDAVTSGMDVQRVHLSRCHVEMPVFWRKLRDAMALISENFAAPFFVEFAFDDAGALHVFQVRADRRPLLSAEGLTPSCHQMELAAASIESNGPLSVMADWNPMEMLGRDPKPLDVSLYDELLMSGAWADGRVSLGWHKPDMRQLTVELGGQPYVRLRESFRTLLPRGLPVGLVNALLEDRMKLLGSAPELHDKVEFRIMWSAFPIDEETTRAHLLDRGFDVDGVNRLFVALKRVTRDTIREAGEHLRADRAGMSDLRLARRRLAKLGAEAPPHKVSSEIKAALEMCRTKGTIPFSRQARIAFTFRFIINQLVEQGALHADAVQEWEAGLNTIAGKLAHDLAKLEEGTLPRRTFDRRYGHLRPRTYSLESLRYDEQPKIAGPPSLRSRGTPTAAPYSACLPSWLKTIGVKLSQPEFWEIAADAYRGREELKFGFTALLSDILQTLAKVAEWTGLDRRQLRALRISRILNLMDAADNWHSFANGVDAAIQVLPPPTKWHLPDIILDKNDLYVVRELEPRPTFIGANLSQGPLQVVTGDGPLDTELNGVVVAIEAPDPGFDWIFAQPLAGLISAYGGEFSHMGVRCAEFRIPAALGCGARLFDSIAGSEKITIDAGHAEIWNEVGRLFP